MFLEEQTDEKIMAEVAKGNLDLLKVLFERHHVHVFNFLFKMSKDKMLSEDITQDVFYKVMKYRTSYNNGKFVSWMFTITRNSLKSHYTRESEKHQDLDSIFHLEHEKIEHKKEEVSHLHEALDRLEASDKELLILNRFQEIKYVELAEIMDSTPGAVKTRVSRALQKLKKIYFENI